MDFITLLRDAITGNNMLVIVLMVALIVFEMIMSKKWTHNDDEILVKMKEIVVANDEIGLEIANLKQTMIEKFEEFEETDMYIITRLNTLEITTNKIAHVVFPNGIPEDEEVTLNE